MQDSGNRLANRPFPDRRRSSAPRCEAALDVAAAIVERVARLLVAVTVPALKCREDAAVAACELLPRGLIDVRINRDLADLAIAVPDADLGGDAEVDR